VRLAFLIAVLGCASAQTRLAVQPKDNGKALVNPGMGWVLHYYDNSLRPYGYRLAAWDTVEDFPGLSVVYLRLAWSYLEPEEGKFNWSVVDTPARRWISRGKQVAFRFTCSESGRDQAYATPRWVEKAGAKGYRFTPGKGVDSNGANWEPDFDDPVFLSKLDHFLAAAAARYDGNPEVAFLDVGSLGVWGEGHTFSSTRKPYTAGTVKRHIDLHLKHFPHTLLAANDDFASQGRGQETIAYALEKGLTLRDDSILVQGGGKEYLSAEMAQPFWPKLPVVLESEHYGGSKQRGVWGDGLKYLEAVEKYHASYASIHWYPREFLAENRDLVERMNQKLGYRLQLVEATLEAGQKLGVNWTWWNVGVAPALPGGHPAVTLKDDRDGIAAVFVDEGFDVRSLPPESAKPATRALEFAYPPSLEPGRYSVFVSVGTRTGTARIALPYPAEDGQRRYKIGTIEIEEGGGVRSR
jgi:hypothetical protein